MMIENPGKQDLVDLIGHESGCCVSILMRTHQSGRATNQNPIRFKNLVNEAIEKLADRDQPLRSRLEKLRELEHDFEFWQHQSAGFAVFLCEDFQQRFRLPHAPADIAFVGDHFYVSPLATSACGGGTTRALALSWEHARLLASDGHDCCEIENDHFPVSWHELVIARDPEEQLQFHTHSTKGGGPSGPSTGSTAIYHGHGEGEDKIDADRDAYLSRVGELVGDEIYNTDHPLILVATDEVAGHFKSMTKVNVVKQIHGSPDGMRDQELESKINSTSHELLQQHRESLMERLGTAIATEQGSRDLADIIVQAADGRVDTLLVGDLEPLWGRFDREQRRVEKSEERSTDLINIAVRETLRAGGTVVRQSSDDIDGRVAALYRY